jgi:folate-binding protein YgfZ
MLMTGFYPFKPASWLSVEGEDAPEFLQGQFTNYLPLEVARSCTYGLWLDRRGRVQADGFVLRTHDDGFHIFSYSCLARPMVERLEAFIIADDVEVSDETQEVGGISLVGEAAAAILGMRCDPPAPGEVAVTEEGFVFAGRRTHDASFEWVMAADRIPAVLTELREVGLRELTRGQVDRLRLDAGIPSVPDEIGPGDLPQEGGLERDAVSFTKGCYLGQEVMARLQATGRVRRRLVQVRVQGSVSLPAPLYHEATQAGELRSLIEGEGDGANGWALVKVGIEPGDGLSFEPDGPARLQVLGQLGEDFR